MWHGKTLAVVLPTYNEAGSIAECIMAFHDLGIVDDIVVVNHHLLCADASVRHGEFGEVIPACDTAIIDEAHQLASCIFIGYSVAQEKREHDGAANKVS